MSTPGKEYLEELLNLLVGAKIVDVYVDEEGMDCWPVLVVDLADHMIDKDSGQRIRSEVLVSQDMECNGPGALLGLHEIKDMINA